MIQNVVEKIIDKKGKDNTLIRDNSLEPSQCKSDDMPIETIEGEDLDHHHDDDDIEHKHIAIKKFKSINRRRMFDIIMKIISDLIFFL